jgi:hypothetical protein
VANPQQLFSASVLKFGIDMCGSLGDGHMKKFLFGVFASAALLPMSALAADMGAPVYKTGESLI